MSRRWPAYAAAIWAFSFAGASFYWAAGGSVGTGTIAADVDEAGIADPSLLGATGILKAVAGLLALALVRPFGRVLPGRPLGLATWATAVVMVLYAAVSFVDHALMAAGVRSTPSVLGSTAVRWHLALWDPFWLLGGILFVAAARSFQPESHRVRPHEASYDG